MRSILAIAVAGAVGVLARYAVQSSISVHGRFPWATFVVNVSGAFAAGFLFTVIGRRYSVPMWIQSALFIGFLGGYTTFSAMSLDTYTLVERGQLMLAASYAIGSVIGGLAAIVVGVRFGRAV